jgi:hypothetical protein
MYVLVNPIWWVAVSLHPCVLVYTTSSNFSLSADCNYCFNMKNVEKNVMFVFIQIELSNPSHLKLC